MQRVKEVFRGDRLNLYEHYQSAYQLVDESQLSRVSSVYGKRINQTMPKTPPPPRSLLQQHLRQTNATGLLASGAASACDRG